MSSHRPHPYTGFEGTFLWSAIDRALQQLTANRDLVETTAHEDIVGFLCKALVEPVSASSQGPSPASRRQALRSVREAVRKANVSNRDLVQELIDERRLEAQHG